MCHLHCRWGTTGYYARVAIESHYLYRKPLQDELTSLRRELGVVASRPTGFTASDIYPFQEKVIPMHLSPCCSSQNWRDMFKLRQIERSRSDLFSPKDGSEPLAGQGLIIGLMEQLYEETHDLIASTESISASLVPLADRLKEIKAQLERLVLTHRWTLRETDLHTFQVYIPRTISHTQRPLEADRLFVQLQLQDIEKLRVDGKFKDPDGNVPEGQAMVNFLLRGCYRLITKMLSENVPVAEALMPIYNQLSTVRRCLVEVTKWGKPDSRK